MTRRTIPDAEKAQAALDVNHRALTKARKHRDQLKVDLKAAEAEVTAREKRRDYLAQNPDLPPVQNADTYTEPADRGAVEKLSGGAAVAGESA